MNKLFEENVVKEIQDWINNLGEIKCPVCGGNDIAKRENDFYCQSTGKSLVIKFDYTFEFVEKNPTKPTKH